MNSPPQNKRAKLVPVTATGNTARVEVILGERVRIGRVPGNELVLNDPEVSKQHAEIVAERNEFVLRDLNSSNGTFVDGSRVTQHTLRPNEVIEMGSARYAFTLIVEATSAQAVAILPKSPIDQTVFLAASELQVLEHGRDISNIDNLRKLYDRVSAAFEAVQGMVSTTDLPALCEKFLQAAFQLVRAETGAVLLYDANKQLVPWAHRGIQDGDQRIVISRTIVEEVMKRRAAVLANDALTDSRWGGAKSVVMSGVRSLMCVPLASGDQVFGLLHVGNSHEVGAFTASDLELINGIGVGAGIVLANAFLAKRLLDEERTRDSLGRFLSPVLLEKVLANSVDLKRGGHEAEVTVMFADIRGFTPLTERSQASSVVELLNEYFDQMVEVVFRHGGVLDKFIGDALMAVWGAPVATQNDAANAIAAARQMQQTLAVFNTQRRSRGEDPVLIGIGLASGKCVSGFIGARRRMDFTVIGDAVNLASRLAGVATAGKVVCDDETYKRARQPANMQAREPVKVKGKTQPIPIFESVVPVDEDTLVV